MIDGKLYYKFPFADMAIRTMPATVIHNLYYIAVRRITDEASAASYLQRLVDVSFNLGVHFFLYVEEIATLPDSIAQVVKQMDWDHSGKVYTKDLSTMPYEGQELLAAFGC